MSLNIQITEYLRGKSWVHKGELGRKAVIEWGYLSDNLGRTCRKLENEGKLERELRKNANTGVYEVWYKLKDTPIPERVLKFQAEFNKPVVKENTLF